MLQKTEFSYNITASSKSALVQCWLVLVSLMVPLNKFGTLFSKVFITFLNMFLTAR